MAGAAGAVRDDVFTSKNAATWYLRAVEESERLGRGDWDAVADLDADTTRPPPRAVRDAVARGRKVIDLAQRGAARDYADFDLDYAQGAEMLLPHLGRLRAIARLMRADALIRLHDGDVDGASRLVASMYRMAEHLSGDRTIVSSLVGMAIFAHADEAAQAAFDRAAFNAAHGSRLLQAVRRLDRPDPFQITEAVAMEQTVMVDWVDREFQEHGSDAEILAELVSYAPDDVDPLEVRQALEADFDTHLAAYDEAMGRTVEAFANPDRDAGRAQLETVSAEVLEGEHGVLAMLMMPALTKVFDLVLESRRRVDERLTMLDGLATGQIQPRDEANAAYLYLRAIEMLGKIEPSRLQRLRAFDADPAPALDEPLTMLLDEAAPILDVLREATALSRCDFEFARRGWPPHVAPRYAPGMRDLFRVVHVDAVRQLRARDADATTDRLGILVRMTAHLGQDGVVASALVAHTAFNQVRELAAVVLDALELTRDHRADLHAGALRLQRSDPFGYIAGVVLARNAVADYYRMKRPEDEAARKRLQAAVDATERLDGDGALFLVVTIDSLERTESDLDAADAGLAPLGDVMDLEALAAARRLTPRVSPALTEARLEVLAGLEVSGLAHVAARQRQARSDLRAGLRILEAPPAATDAAGDDAPARPR